jgi:hypothetical protein
LSWYAWLASKPHVINLKPFANIFEYSSFVFIRRVEHAAGAWLDGMQARPFRG